MAVLVTGAAGFIGSHVVRALRARGECVVALDAFVEDAAVRLKHGRVAALYAESGVRVEHGDVANFADISATFAATPSIDRVVHLAAHAGVRPSGAHPLAFTDANVRGHVAVLEAARAHGVRHTVYASSSSVYGRTDTPWFSEDVRVDAPESVYGATKLAAEHLAHSYAAMHGTPVTGLRFFTVYGPWGRPDMAYTTFTSAILAGQPVTLYGYGCAQRDFTYIDDIVDGVLAALDRPPCAAPPHRVYNLGNHRCERVSRFLDLLAAACGRKAAREFAPLPAGDVPYTAADIARARAELGYEPRVSLEDGLEKFVQWYRWYHGV